MRTHLATAAARHLAVDRRDSDATLAQRDRRNRKQRSHRAERHEVRHLIAQLLEESEEG